MQLLRLCFGIGTGDSNYGVTKERMIPGVIATYYIHMQIDGFTINFYT